MFRACDALPAPYDFTQTWKLEHKIQRYLKNLSTGGTTTGAGDTATESYTEYRATMLQSLTWVIQLPPPMVLPS
ncbi:hypothetical protein BHE74_00034776 [Ensete ventricosum]|nr:hypothetical protein BHE74_00034776 [Ensete ventricosum]RZS03566.1 hypothetical protein BHM03_00033762 [Ensete ventricosum]